MTLVVGYAGVCALPWSAGIGVRLAVWVALRRLGAGDASVRVRGRPVGARDVWLVRPPGSQGTVVCG
ncbi:MAG: hypothetical protein ACE5HA_18060 [Anaerolineae bacterium]